MVVLLALVLVYLLLLVLDRFGLRPPALRTRRAKLRAALAAMFLLAASSRLVSPETLLQMIPESLPLRREALMLSGLFEVLGAIGLLVPRLRRTAGLGLALLLVAVFPANLHVALNNLQIEGYPGSPFYQWARLPIQAVLIWLTLWASRAIRPGMQRPARVPIRAA